VDGSLNQAFLNAPGAEAALFFVKNVVEVVLDDENVRRAAMFAMLLVVVANEWENRTNK